MSLPDKIFLIGMPGSGKTTAGKLLAEHLSVQFIDLDEQIEVKAESTIKEIFEEHDEEYFRELEQQTLHEVIKLTDKAVIATGGGTPCFFDNMDVMKASGLTVYIMTPLKTIEDRINHTERSKRPKFADGDLAEKLEQLNQERSAFYGEADIVWNGEHFSELLALLK